MRRFILVALMVVTVAGCDRFPDLSIQVVANLPPSAGDCTIMASQTEVLFGGLFDLAPSNARPYFINPKIESFLYNNSLDFQGAQNMQIESFDLTILLPDHSQPDFGSDLPNPYRQPTSAVIPPATSPGSSTSGVASAIGIPAAYYGALQDIESTTGFDSILLEIRANGTTSGNFSQQSPSFFWPVSFCNGCLGTTCEPPLEAGSPAPDSCYPGQDIWEYCAAIAATP
ncbi:MAG: hypothetical protein WAU39_21070 [Polyangiales bacterium]